MDATLSIAGRTFKERTLWIVVALVALFTPIPWILATPMLVLSISSPIIPIAVVVGLLAVLASQVRKVTTPKRARLWSIAAYVVAYGPAIFLWFLVLSFIPLDGPLFVLTAAVAIGGVFAIAASLAVGLFEVSSRILANAPLNPESAAATS